MALTIDLQLDPSNSSSITTAGPRAAQQRVVKTYTAGVSDPANPSLKPSDTSPEDVLTILAQSDSLPVVNFDLLTKQVGSEYWYVPWLQCSGKRCERDSGNKFVFRIAVEFSTGQRGKLEEEHLRWVKCPNDAAGIATMPYLREYTYAGRDRVIEVEAVTGGRKPLMLPTGTLYSEPFLTRFPHETFRQTQFEPDAGEAQVRANLRERLYSVPSTVFDTEPAEPPKFQINAADYHRFRVPQLNGQAFITGYVMTYGIDRSLYPGGFWDRRALIDRSYLTVAGDLSSKIPAKDPAGGTTIIDVKLNKDGTLLEDQKADPIYEDYRVQPAIDWSFMRQ